MEQKKILVSNFISKQKPLHVQGASLWYNSVHYMKPTQTIHYIKGKSFQITIHFALFDSPKKWVPLTCIKLPYEPSLRVDTTKVGENLPC